MLSLFQRKRKPSAIEITSPPIAELPSGLIQPESATALLATARRQRLLEHIWQRTSLSRIQFAKLYLAPLERYAELVQQFPASEAHHHAYHGGMLDHGLEIVAFALKLKQSHLLPVGAAPEDQSAQAEAWTAAIAYAALLHDIGKIAVDLHVEYTDGGIWHPWHGPVRRPYRFRYRKDREYRLHGAATGLLYTRVLDCDTLDWLSNYPELWSSLLYVLAGQYEHAGVLGELIIKADQASVAQALGGDPTKAMAAPKHALQRKLLEGLRYLLRDELKLNQPQASDGWFTEDALWLVSKTVSDKLRAHLLSQGIEGIPANNTAVFDVLQDHGILQPTPGGKAIWKAKVTSEAGWSHAFTFLRLAPALVWEAEERPDPYAGTVVPQQEEAGTDSSDSQAISSTTAVLLPQEGAQSLPSTLSSTPPAPVIDDVDALLSLFEADATPISEAVSEQARTQPPDAIPSNQPARPVPIEDARPAELPSGEHFIAWLRQGIQARKLIINDARALVHTVADTAYLVSPGIFQRYAQEYLQVKTLAKQEGLSEWRWVQKRFERLQLHRKHPSGLNIWICVVSGPRKSRQLHGYLLNEASVLFELAPTNNPYLALKAESNVNNAPGSIDALSG
ncbi:integrating conjugative element relaxase, PFL_4751 family [Halopseudomonas litoralis]|uniref:Integrating conjugative element relaxase, PFL_4751 family n=1 Tax=Halopseudomonas litoralis TaxID=797277 RepID=A0A1H1QEU9_9GAMM|nr:MobH family relaxase [Halopseudomonas litoralis]SDS21813.1 integrating conjugative element relaxase, PFL_4751 family [Halopseudomonas litoralis]